MAFDNKLLRRVPPELRGDSSRVVARLYLPGQEILNGEIPRIGSLLDRVMGMTDEEVSVTLSETIDRFAERHQDVRAIFMENFGHVAHRLPRAVDISADRCALIGAYFTK